MAIAKDSSADDFVITRTFDAPRRLMFELWTDPKHLAHWFGPKGCALQVLKFDLKPGGVLHSCMKTPDGREMYGKWVFREITPPERVVWVNSFSDKNGGLTRHPMSPTWPLEMLTTATFVEQGARTKVTLQWSPINPTEAERDTFNGGHEGMNMGWSGSFEQLEAYLKDLKEKKGGQL